MNINYKKKNIRLFLWSHICIYIYNMHFYIRTTVLFVTFPLEILLRNIVWLKMYCLKKCILNGDAYECAKLKILHFQSGQYFICSFWEFL